MSEPVLAPVANPSRATKWGLMFLGIVCLGIGMWSASGAFVDLDFINVNSLNSWPPQVIIEISIALMQMNFGLWCLLEGVRSTGRNK
jgi:hypothetical protein